MTTLPEIGSVIANRFVIEALAGSGGMGTVFKARDCQSGGVVALKLCQPVASLELARFSREIRALAALRHPGIVGYVADGHTGEGAPFLAMEWLEGEDLAQRLRRQPLTPVESLRLLERITSALAAAHRAQIVHRDLKPSNVFLRGGRADDAVLLDFGVARLGAATLSVTMTATGTVIGTPSYMSPEQARGDHDVGPAADLFSLGSLLFECLTGNPPFGAEHVMAVLAKIVCEQAPRLSSVWPGAPEPLDDLMARLFAKDPAARPSADALLAELPGLELLPLGLSHTIVQAPAFQGPEQQILSAVLAVLPGAWSSGPDTFGGPLEALRIAFLQHNARVELLADGSIVLVFSQTGDAAPTDRAAQAARCALLLKEQFPAARVAIVTGHGILRSGTPSGNALDRAAELLAVTPPASAPAHAEPAAPIWIDDVTAGLLGPSFAVRDAGGRRQLLAEHATLDPTRLLLGKPTPCVGREIDLSALAAAVTNAVEERCAHVLVVRAPPGMGKSRLRHELVHRATAQYPELIVVLGRCDRVADGSSYGLLGQAVRELCGVLDGTAPEEIRARLSAWVGEHIAAGDARRIVAFLGELCGVPFPDEHLVELRSARRDAGLMAEHITRAFVTVLRAECSARPLLLVLEDLQWGDKPTVRMIDAALRALEDLPFVVLALARPEVDELFPRLWEEHGPLRITLRPLGRQPCERLCRGVLGSSVPAATIDRIIDQSGGNALLLEELIRAVAEGKGEALPESVLAMLQARLLRLAPAARRVLCAASIFGETFWHAGVCALLSHASHEEVGEWLQVLVQEELIVREPQSRLASETAYRFRRTLTRDAAYSMLSDDDRIVGHRVAGRFLEAAGERDPIILAQHFVRG